MEIQQSSLNLMDELTLIFDRRTRCNRNVANRTDLEYDRLLRVGLYKTANKQITYNQEGMLAHRARMRLLKVMCDYVGALGVLYSEPMDPKLQQLIQPVPPKPLTPTRSRLRNWLLRIASRL